MTVALFHIHNIFMYTGSVSVCVCVCARVCVCVTRGPFSLAVVVSH